MGDDPVRVTEFVAHVARAASGARARPGRAPEARRLERLAHEVAQGTYRVPPDHVAEAMLRSSASLAGRPDEPDP